MGKVKKSDSKAAKAADPLTAVKNAGVTKAADSPKAKSKQLAKDVATKAALNGKAKDLKKKKKVESSSESESESESEASSDDAESEAASSSDDSSEAEGDSDSDSGSDSSDSDEEEKPKKSTKAAAKVTTNGKAKAAESSDSSDSSDSEDEAADTNKTTNGAQVKADSSDEDSSDSDEAEEDSDDSDKEEDSSEAVEEKKPEAQKKRKAEEEVSTPFKKSKVTEASDEYTTLFAGNLGWGVTDDILYETFKDCEGLSNARVVTDKAMQRSRGFGYVDFESHEAAKAAFDKMQGFELEGRALNLDPSKPRPAGDEAPGARANDRAKQFGDSVSPESDTLFVGNLPFEVDEDIVGAFFGETCEIKSIRLPKDQYVTARPLPSSFRDC
ncbi:hypothetical protein F4777DRAFT_544729 [Nemania sp. FL0916]|nr:hypothetical protein F4777DRAFT_544729 [Nemania sp. FL0916]